ncbi:Uncharacterised protein [uncultured archaeon]|nr:Uncharacterised protein [uncultured archaeon]
MRPTCGLQNIDGTFEEQVVRPSDQSSWTNLVPSRFSSSWSHIWQETVAHSRLVICFAFVLFLLCSTAISQPVARPETGTLIKDVARNGYGELIIHNNWTMYTVAVLTDSKVKPLLAVYIRSKDSYKITKIEDGSYGLYFTVGNLWDAQARKFRSVLGYYRYNPPLVFQTNENETDIEYSIFELDLYEAGASNFVPEQFEFPDLS